MKIVLLAVVVLGALGAIFGLVLAFAAKKFAVELDPRQEELAALLPGANCGGCGFAGCGAYAAAIAAGTAPVNLCAAGGAAFAEKAGEIMGVSAGDVQRSVALVRCSGGDRASRKYNYSGIGDCSAAMQVSGGPLLCQYGCLGLGACVSACKFGAMKIVNGRAVVDRELCTGCMACAKACPRGLIVKVPYDSHVAVACASIERGAALRKFCDIGCLGCKLCEKACKHDAVHVKDNLATVDMSKCVSCGECVAKCPRKLIRDVSLPDTPAAAESAE